MVTGETVATLYFVGEIMGRCRNTGRRCVVIEINNQAYNLSGFFARLGSYLLALGWAFWFRVKGKRANFYAVCPGGLTAFALGILLLPMRLFCENIVIHHHGRRWFDNPNAILGCLVFGSRMLNLTQCNAMVHRAKLSYPKVRVYPMSNACLVESRLTKDHATRPLQALGYIANLTLEKGVDTALETARACQDRDAAIRTIFAGAPQSQAVKNVLEQAVVDGLALEQRGFVSGIEKAQFFYDIDVLLFPTRYAMEVQPIVTLEALSYGLPVLATDIGCLAETLADGAGKAVSSDDDFKSIASAQVRAWAENPHLFVQARECAHMRFIALRKESLSQMEEYLLGSLCP